MKKWWLIKWWRLQWWFIKWRSRLMMVLIVLMCSLGTYVWNFRAHEISKNPESWAHFGDYLGGIFSFFSFMALLYTVHLQIQELRATKEELRATKEELKLSRQAQQESAVAQEQSAEVLRKQQFENTFFQLLNQVTLHLNKLIFTTTDNKNIITELHLKLEKYKFFPLIGRMRDNLCCRDLVSQLETNNFYSKIKQFQENCHDDKPEFPQFCLLVYQILKLIKNSPYSHNKAEATNEEKQYSNFLRAILTPEILQLMALYCYRQEQKSSFKHYQELIERYALFEHMPFHLREKEKNNFQPTMEDIDYFGQRYFYLLIYIFYKYDRSAFGNNETLKLIEPELDKVKKVKIE